MTGPYFLVSYCLKLSYQVSLFSNQCIINGTTTVKQSNTVIV